MPTLVIYLKTTSKEKNNNNNSHVDSNGHKNNIITDFFLNKQVTTQLLRRLTSANVSTYTNSLYPHSTRLVSNPTKTTIIMPTKAPFSSKITGFSKQHRKQKSPSTIIHETKVL